MVLTPETLFVAGLPDVLDEGQLNADLGDPQLRAKAAQQTEAWLGRQGGLLLAVSPASGQTQAECRLAAPPVFDGMAAADKKLYVSLEDGTVVCFGK
jgi:hypothetical protein